MKLGISSYSYTWAIGVPGKMPRNPMDFTDLLAKADELGVDLIQVADNLPFDRLNSEELAEYARLAQASGIALEVGARGMTDSSLEEYIGIAERAGSSLLRFVIDGPGYRPDLDTIHGVITNACPVLAEKNIILALENYERLKAKDFVKIVERAGSDQVGICLDSVNSIGAGEGLETVVKLLAPLTVNLHMKEFTIKRIYHMMGFQVEGVPAGEGMLNIPWLLQQVGNHCRSAILEQWVPPEPAIEDTVLKEAAWAKQSIEYLQTIIH